MATHMDIPVVKQVGANGQVSLGKEYAGKQIQISKLKDGALIIKSGQFIPDSERWLYSESNIKHLEKAIKWTESTPRRDNFEEIVTVIEND